MERDRREPYRAPATLIDILGTRAVLSKRAHHTLVYPTSTQVRQGMAAGELPKHKRRGFLLQNAVE